MRLGHGLSLTRAGVAAAHRGGAVIPSDPSILLTDPYYASNTVLLTGAGSAGGTSIVDRRGFTWTAQGNAQTDGSGDIAFDGSGDAVYLAMGSALGTADLTIDMLVHINSLASDGELFAVSSPGRGLSSFDMVFEYKTTGALRASVQNGAGGANVDITSAGAVVAAGNDYYIQFTVEGTTARLRAALASAATAPVIATGTVTGTRSNQQTECRVGELSASAGYPRYLNGKLNWLRVTKALRLSGSGSATVPSGLPPSWKRATYAGTRLTVTGVSDDAQGVATDGTNLWFSSSSTLYKYSKTGTLITSRSVTGDAPTDKAQINGLFYSGGYLYVSAAKFATTGTAWIAKYDPTTLAYIEHHQITGDWFSEGLAFKDGYWWVCFHANKVVAKVNPADWSVVATYPLNWPVTGSSGGYGAGTGYDGIAWVGNYLLCNIHEIYDQDYLDVYYWNGTSFDQITRLARPTTIATQGIALDPVESGVLWCAERNLSGGSDSMAKVTLG